MYFNLCRLVYNPENHTTSNSPGVQTKIPGFGKTEHIEWLDPDVHVHYSSSKCVANLI